MFSYYRSYYILATFFSVSSHLFSWPVLSVRDFSSLLEAKEPYPTLRWISSELAALKKVITNYEYLVKDLDQVANMDPRSNTGNTAKLSEEYTD